MTISVIGAGLGRTGTMSLKLALERLGFGPCYHMVEVLDDPAGRSPQWEAAADGKPVEWDAIFKGYRSTVDWPGATFWREIVAAYPGAKVILTERDPEDWYRSIEQTIFSRRMPHDPKDPWARMTTKVVRGMFDGVVDDRDHAIAVFERHNRAGVPLYLWYGPGAAEPQVLPQVLTPGMLTALAADRPSATAETNCE